MFGVGLHFSLKDLLAVRRIVFPGAAVQVIFIAQAANGTLNPKDTYTSDWVGFANDKPQIHTLGGKGERIIGITGYKGAGNVVTALGLVQELPPGQAPAPATDKPLAPEKSVE